MHFFYTHVALNDTADSLKHEFRDDDSNTVCVLGGYDLSQTHNFAMLREKYNKVIMFNQEPLLASQHQFMHKNYFYWLKAADEVWDYDEQNLALLKTVRPDAQLHILKPYKDYGGFGKVKKDIDILFYRVYERAQTKNIGQVVKVIQIKVCTDI